MRALVGNCAVGLGLGFVLERIGFASWDEVHRMFVFADLRLLLTFVGAVVLLLPTWLLLRRHAGARFASRRIHPGSIPGGLLFGAGWAITGACPAIGLVQLGEGRAIAACTLLGLLVGNALYPAAHARWFRWTAGSCTDD